MIEGTKPRVKIEGKKEGREERRLGQTEETAGTERKGLTWLNLRRRRKDWKEVKREIRESKETTGTESKRPLNHSIKLEETEEKNWEGKEKAK